MRALPPSRTWAWKHKPHISVCKYEYMYVYKDAQTNPHKHVCFNRCSNTLSAHMDMWWHWMSWWLPSSMRASLIEVLKWVGWGIVDVGGSPGPHKKNEGCPHACECNSLLIHLAPSDGCKINLYFSLWPLSACTSPVMVAAVSCRNFMLNLLWWVLGNNVLKLGLDIEYGDSNVHWHPRQGVLIAHVGAAMIHCTAFRMDIHYVSGL